MRAAQSAFLREQWQVIVKVAGVFGGVALLYAVVPVHLSNAARGFFVGVMVTSGVGLVVHEFLSESHNDAKLLGLWAEEDWSRKLLDKSRHVWKAVHRVEFSGFDVDHVAITPAGVLAVETKYVSAWRDDKWCRGHLDQARRNARTMRSFLRSRQGDMPSVTVHAVLLLWGPGSRVLEGKPQEHEGVTVLPGRTATDLLSRYGAGPVSKTMADALYERVRAYVRVREAHQAA